MIETAALEHELDDGLQALQIVADDRARRRLLDYLALLVKWNQVYNLTSVRDPRDMLVVHLLDSLSVLALADTIDARAGAGALLDVGSGAGLPAVPLAIMRPRSVWSVDAVAKKISFQVQVKAALHLENLHPLHARIEAVDCEALGMATPPALIVSRAYADLGKMLASIDHLAGPHTTIVAMKGVVPAAEIAALPPGWMHDVVGLDVPFLGAERCAVVLTRAR